MRAKIGPGSGLTDSFRVVPLFGRLPGTPLDDDAMTAMTPFSLTSQGPVYIGQIFGPFWATAKSVLDRVKTGYE